MAPKGRVEPEKISIVDFIIEKASLNSTFGKTAEDVDNHTMEINYTVGFNPKQKLAKADIYIEVGAVCEKEEIAHGHFGLTFIYHVDNMDELVEKEEDGDGLIVNGGLSNSLASITYSTTRGIVMTRFQGTLLKDFILPIIDPQTLLKKEE